MHKRILVAAAAAFLSLPLAVNAAEEGKKKGGEKKRKSENK